MVKKEQEKINFLHLPSPILHPILHSLKNQKITGKTINKTTYYPYFTPTLSRGKNRPPHAYEAGVKEVR